MIKYIVAYFISSMLVVLSLIAVFDTDDLLAIYATFGVAISLFLVLCCATFFLVFVGSVYVLFTDA